MPDKKTLDDVLQEIISSAPKVTPLGKRAFGTSRRNSIRIPKNKKINPDKEKQEIIKRLKLLEKEIDWGNSKNKKKSKNVFNRTQKEIVAVAISELANHFTLENGYKATWINSALDLHWQAGRKIKHSYEKRVMVGELIYFCIKNKMTQRQAFRIAEKIYGFKETEIKETYRYFKRDVEKYYFPHIKIKNYIPIRITLDIIKYGRIAGFRLSPHVAKKAQMQFENILQNAFELLKKEIQFAQKNKLEKIGIEIDPIILKYINQEYAQPEGLILELQKAEEEKAYFVFCVNQFLNDLELYQELA